MLPEARRPRAAFSSPRSQFFTVQTDPKAVNNLFIFSSFSNDFVFIPGTTRLATAVDYDKLNVFKNNFYFNNASNFLK